METLIELDKELMLFLNGIHNPFWDQIMWYISAKFTWVPLYLVVVYFLFKQKKEYGWYALFFMVMVIVFSDQISTKCFKHVFERFRPSRETFENFKDNIHIVNGYTGGRYGFVSSHATNSWGFAIFSLLLFKRRWYAISICLWAFIVSYSRIYLGVHYPGDILGGTILGILIALVLFRIYMWFVKAKQEKLHNWILNLRRK